MASPVTIKKKNNKKKAAGRKTVKIPPFLVSGGWGIEGRHPPTVVVFGFRCCPQYTFEKSCN
jgi:hypothetical protein